MMPILMPMKQQQTSSFAQSMDTGVYIIVNLEMVMLYKTNFCSLALPFYLDI